MFRRRRFTTKEAIKAVSATLRNQVERRVDKICKAAKAGKASPVNYLTRQVLDLHKMEAVLKEFRQRRGGPLKPLNTEPVKGIRTYLTDVMTLQEAHCLMTRGTDEWMLAVTGAKHGNNYTLSRLFEMGAAHQSKMAFKGDDEAIFQVLGSLSKAGLLLQGVFHSHRFNGTPSPSGVDKALQKCLESGGYPVVQAVFSDDGYVKFFGGEHPFEVRVTGSCERISKNVFKLNN